MEKRLEKFSDSVGIEIETLSDGSEVFDVIFETTGPERTHFSCEDRNHALALADGLTRVVGVATSEKQW